MGDTRPPAKCFLNPSCYRLVDLKPNLKSEVGTEHSWIHSGILGELVKQLAVDLEPLTMFCMWAFSGWPGKLAKTVYGGALLSCLGWGGGALLSCLGWGGGVLCSLWSTFGQPLAALLTLR